MSFSSPLRKVREAMLPFRSAFQNERLLSPAWIRYLGGKLWYAAGEVRPADNVKPRSKTPLGKLDQSTAAPKANSQNDPYAPFPNNTNPLTGEIGGPTGPEPTRYGDWERKGRVTDF